MKKTMVLASLILASFGVLSGVAALRSEALGGEALDCAVNPTPSTPFTAVCGPRQAAELYRTTFEVLDESGSYTYAWSVSTPGGIVGGCTSTSNTCIVSTEFKGIDQTVSVSVILTQGGQQSTLQSSATLPATCAGIRGWAFC